MPRALLALLLLATGCSGPLVRDAPDADAPADFPNHTAEQIVARVTASVSAVERYRSEARITVEQNGSSQRANASLRAAVADSLTAVVRGPLAIEAARALVTADSFFAHDKLSRTFYLGPLRVADSYVPGAGEPGALARNLLGLIAPDPSVPWRMRATDTQYFLSEAGEGVRRRYMIDPAVWRVTIFEEVAPDGSVLTRRQFSAFDLVDGIVIPREVRMESVPDASSVAVEHRQVTLNPTSLSFPFRRPSGVEVVRID